MKPKTLALRSSSGRRVAVHFLGRLAVGVVIFAVALLDDVLSSGWLPEGSVVLAGVVSLPLVVYGGCRALLDGGVLPRMWIRPRGDDFVLWSALSAIRGKYLFVATDTPAVVTLTASQGGAFPGTVGAGWVTIEAGNKRLTLTVYADDVPPVLERILDQVRLTDISIVNVVHVAR